MKRVITIILIILVVLGVLLGISWLVARKTAQKAGTTPPTFRQFLSIGGSTPSKNPSSSDLSSVFTANPSGSSSGSNSNTVPQPGVRISQFTNNTLTPVNNLNDNGNGGPIIPGDNGGGVGDNGGGVGGGDSGGGVGQGGGGPAVPACSDADLNITFTPSELARLQALQNKFYAVAQSIHSDADVATEVANHDAFRAKADQISELYLYCQAKSPLLADATLKKHTPTPYWHDILQDSWTFITADGPVGGTVALDDMNRGQHIIEKILHINLW